MFRWDLHVWEALLPDFVILHHLVWAVRVEAVEKLPFVSVSDADKVGQCNVAVELRCVSDSLPDLVPAMSNQFGVHTNSGVSAIVVVEHHCFFDDGSGNIDCVPVRRLVEIWVYEGGVALGSISGVQPEALTIGHHAFSVRNRACVED